MALTSDRLFLDTSYAMARFNRRDEHHHRAKQLAATVANSQEIWTTDAVLLEIAAAFSRPDHRAFAISIWDEFHGGNPRCHSFPAAGQRLEQAVQLFRERSDKSWSLADCLSFVVMRELQLREALSSDRHFIQSGFAALLVNG